MPKVGRRCDSFRKSLFFTFFLISIKVKKFVLLKVFIVLNTMVLNYLLISL